MNKNIIIISTFLIIFLASYFLYWQGERAIQKASTKFDVLAFRNPDLNCNQRSLTFFIENNQNQENLYQITISINGKELKERELILAPLDKKEIKPEEELVTNVCSNNEIISRYQVSVTKNNTIQNIYKIINYHE